MTTPEDITNSDIIKKRALEAYRKYFTNITLACAEVKISRQTFYRWWNEDEEFGNKILGIKEELINMGESRLIEMGIMGSNITALIFFLKKNKPDIYGDKMELSGTIKTLSGLEHLSDEELRAELKKIQDKRTANNGGSLPKGESEQDPVLGMG